MNDETKKYFIDEYLKEENLIKIKDYKLIDSLMSLLKELFKGKYRLAYPLKEEDVNLKINNNIDSIYEIVSKLLFEFNDDNYKNDTDTFIKSLPKIDRYMKTTIEVTLNSDPSINSVQEIVLTSPGFDAILSYRIAHIFYNMNQLLLSRIISESAHNKTGIDINPGAIIGDRFFIDHGTGIVIGETTVIGNNVKIYQGVTLGALSLDKGRKLHGVKRHPTIQDNVTIYSNASILGGSTIIGKDSTIGANVYITSSIDDNSLVYLCDTGIKIVNKK